MSLIRPVEIEFHQFQSGTLESKQFAIMYGVALTCLGVTHLQKL
jgi:hypothetical protein